MTIWAYIPSKSAPAWACLAKDCEPGSPTWASRIAPSLTLSGKHTPPASWLRAWKKAPWMRHLSGPTCSPSTAELGVAQWIASLRASRAKTSAWPGAAPGLTAPAAASFSTSSTLPTIATRNTSFWRTSQASLLPPLPLWTKKAPPSMSGITTRKAFRKWALKMAAYSKERPPASWENWPTAGGMRNGSLFQRPTWAPAIVGHGGSAGPGDNWTTPDVCSGARDMSKIDPEAQKRADTKRTTGLPTEAAMWLTPNVPNGGRSVSQELVQSKGTTPDGQKRTVGLESQTRFWATPTTNEHTGPGAGPNKTGAPNLHTQVDAWPTPDASASERTNQRASVGAAIRPTIALKAAQWPTPTATDNEQAGSAKAHHLTLHRAGVQWPTPLEFLPPAPAAQSGPASSPATPTSRRHLNPLFGCKLMGWTSTWVIAEPSASSASATALWRSALQQQLSNFFNEQAS